MNLLLNYLSRNWTGIWSGLFIAFFGLLLQLNTAALAQVDGRIVISPKGFNKYNAIELIRNWKYHPGDNPAWADPAFDDSDWEIVGTPLMPGGLPQGGWKGIGWFRLHLEVDEALRNVPLVFSYYQVGASEIYLDGQLIYTFGKVGTSKATEEIDFAIETNHKIGTLSLENQGEYVIAVRYSNFVRTFYQAKDVPLGFWMVILREGVNEIAHRTGMVRNYIRYQFFLVGASLSFTLLHLLLFSFYPRLKENLYYAIFTGSFAAFTFVLFEMDFVTTLEKFIVLFWLFKIMTVVVSLACPRFAYSLFYSRLPRPFWFLSACGLVLGALSWYIPRNAIFLFMLVSLAEMLRVILRAIVQKKNGAWIIGIGVLVLILTGAYNIVEVIFYGSLPYLENIYIYGVLSSLISMSVYLARHFAQTNKTLEKRSVELHQLNMELEERVRQRTADLQKCTEELEVRNRFIRRTFGRYLTDEVVENLLESPEGLRFGGGKREVTILMSDLRGFSSVAENLAPEEVVSLLNTYLGCMTDVILKYEGTIDEFIGDAILVIFGAPVWKADDAERAVACAVEMQLAMEAVNNQNRLNGLPEVEMGIGINTGEVVVGNIGSHRRAKYGVVGKQVNLTARIESYTVGGQILISEATMKETAPLVKVNQQMEVEPKGVKEPITLYEVSGIGGKHNLFLLSRGEELNPLDNPIPIRYTVLEEKFAGRTIFTGSLVKLSHREAEICSEHPVPLLSNLKLQFAGTDGEKLSGGLYGKVVGQPPDSRTKFYLRFTSIPSEVVAFLQELV